MKLFHVSTFLHRKCKLYWWKFRIKKANFCANIYTEKEIGEKRIEILPKQLTSQKGVLYMYSGQSILRATNILFTIFMNFLRSQWIENVRLNLQTIGINDSEMKLLYTLDIFAHKIAIKIQKRYLKIWALGFTDQPR